MALDYANEWWVRLYTRDTTTWKLLSWEARSVLMHLLRKVDRAGVLDVGDDGTAGLAAIIDLPEVVVSDHLPALLKRNCVEFTGTAFILPNFIEAQETPSSEKQRKRASREGRRAKARTGQTVTKRDTESRNVTDGHAESRGVTDGHSEKRREDREEKSVPPADAGAPASLFPEPPAGKRPRRTREKKPRTAQPPDFAPGPSHREKALRLGLSIDDEFRRFTINHAKRGSMWASWDLALHEWLDNAPEFNRGRSGPVNGAPRSPPTGPRLPVLTRDSFEDDR